MNREKKRRMKYDTAAKVILAAMTLEEKISLMSGSTSWQEISRARSEGLHFNYQPYPAGGSRQYQIPALRFCDGPRGVVCGYGEATCFPVPMMRAASFDTALEEKIGRAIGLEVRAAGANFFGGVCVNLPWHPGWGRCQEVYGEDSFTLGAFASALIRGVQSQGVIACAKHFAFNSMENNRFSVSVTCDKRTEREVFLPHFEDCVEAGAGGIMTAYNCYQGIPCGHHKYLLRQVLKEEWGFDGIVISDFFWGISDTRDAALAGMDVEMCHTRYYGKALLRAVQKGLVPRKAIDDAALRILRTMISLNEGSAGSRPKNGSSSSYALSEKQTAAHQKLALKSALEGITLIKNDHHILPFSPEKKRIAVIGRLAAQVNTGDKGSSSVYPPYVVTPLEGILKASGNAEVSFYDGDDTEHVKRMAQAADAVIFVVGLDYQDEGEFNPMKETNIYHENRGGDRKSLSLHRQDIELIRAAGSVNPACAVVLMGGGTILASEWEASVSSILYAWYPGMEGGTAIGKVLFGQANPGGKLPFVLPQKESDLPEIDWETDCQHYSYYHGFRRLEKLGVKPFRPYGFGLSYTTFSLADPSFFAKKGRPGAAVTVKNTGNRSGAEVVQLYVGFPESAVDRPVKTLCGFRRVTLKPGEEKRVEILAPLKRLQYYDEEKQRFILEHMHYRIFIGTSSADEDLHSGMIFV